MNRHERRALLATGEATEHFYSTYEEFSKDVVKFDEACLCKLLVEPRIVLNTIMGKLKNTADKELVNKINEWFKGQTL